jgi:hypothetical protein
LIKRIAVLNIWLLPCVGVGMGAAGLFEVLYRALTN